jgi:hypothetical protein
MQPFAFFLKPMPKPVRYGGKKDRVSEPDEIGDRRTICGDRVSKLILVKTISREE